MAMMNHNFTGAAIPSSRLPQQHQQRERQPSQRRQTSGNPVRCNLCRKSLSGTVFVLSCQCLFCEGKFIRMDARWLARVSWHCFVFVFVFSFVLSLCVVTLFSFAPSCRRVHFLSFREELELSLLQSNHGGRKRFPGDDDFKGSRPRQSKGIHVQTDFCQGFPRFPKPHCRRSMEPNPTTARDGPRGEQVCPSAIPEGEHCTDQAIITDRERP